VKHNGLDVYLDHGSIPQDRVPPKGISESKFGYVRDPATGTWKAATEAIWRESEAMRLGVRPEEVPSEFVCYMVPGGHCNGSCHGGYLCLAYWNPGRNHANCGCLP
jgi:hypothetical protein